MAISHAFSNAIPDGTNTNIVRPSDWNSAHNQYYTLSGNTLGASTVSGTNVVFQGSGNVSLSGTGQTIVLYATGGGTQSVQTQASGGIAGTGFTSTTTTGTAIVGTQNSLGLSLGVPAFVTSAGGGGVAIGASTQTATSGTVNFANSNGISFGMSGSNQITASYAVSALSNGNNITISNTGSSVGISAQAVAAAAGTQTATSGTVNFANSNNITFGMSGSSQITASFSQSVQTQASGNIVGSGFTSTTTTGTAVVGTQNSAGLSLGVPAYLTTQSVQTQASGNIARTGFTSTTTAGTAIVGTLNTSGLSLGVPAYLTTQSVQTQASGNIAGSGFTGANATGTLNSNGLSLSVAAPGAANYSIGVSNLGNTAGSTGITGTRIVFVGTNNISLSQSTDANGATISINQTGGGGGGIAAAAGTQTATSGTVNFANSNGITFGMSGSSQITASFSQSVQTQASGNIVGSGFTSTTTAGTAIVGTQNSAGLSLGVPAYLTTQSVQTQASGNIARTGFTSTTTTGTAVVGTLNTSGLSLGIPAYLTTQSVQTQASGAIAGTGFTSTTTAGTAITAALGTNGLNMAIPAYLTAAAGGGAGNFNLSGATSGNTTASGSTINLSGINITLSGTNGSQIAISAPATSALIAGNNISLSTNGSTISVLAQAVAIGASTQTATSGTINFVNSNGITFGMSGSNQITASYTQSNQAFSASGGSSTFQTLNFANSNGVTFSNSGGSVVASYTVPATTGFAGTGFTSTTVTGTDVQGTLSTNGLSLAVPAYLTAAAGGGGIAAAAGTQTATSGTINFVNSNGITFGMSGSSQITASYTVPTVPTSYVSNVNGSSGQISLNVGSSLSSSTAGSSITFGLASNITTALQSANANYLTSQSNQAFSASGGSSTFQTLNFANSNGVTFSNSGGSVVASYTVPTSIVAQVNGSSGSVTVAGTGTSATNASITLNSNGLAISVAAPGGGGAVNFSAGTTSNNLQTVVFSNSNGVSFGLSGSTITASVHGDYTLSGYNHYNDAIYSAGTVGQGSLIFDHIDLENPVQFDKYGVMLLISNAANSTGSHTVSMSVGLYTQNGSTMSLLGSTSTSVAATLSGTVGSYSLYSGIRQVTIPYTTTLSRGEYFLGVVSSSSSAGANATFNQCRQSALNSNYNGLFGVAQAASNQLYLGMGVYSQTTTAFPASIGFSQIRGTNADAFRPPVVIFQSDIA